MPDLKILVAILACHKNWQYCDYQRITWLKNLKCDHRFFFGRGHHEIQKSDEVRLDVADDYDNLAFKSRAMFAWAVAHDYDFLFKCDDDTYVFPDRLLNSDFAQFDYSGEASPVDGLGKYMAAGGGYWLSRKALDLLVQSPISEHYKPLHLALNGPQPWQEDRWVAEVLHKRGIRPRDDRRYTSKEFANDGSVIAKWEYKSEQMLEEHQRIKLNG